jgi:general secretion pathway protein L
MVDEQRRAPAIWSAMKQAVSALVAEMATMNMLVAEPRSVLRVRPSGIDVLGAEDGRPDMLFTMAGRPVEAVKAVIGRLGTSLPKECALEFAPGLSVSNRMVLPAESPDILRAIVRNKVESIAPWPLSQSIFGLSISPIEGDPAHVTADVAVVSRTLLEDLAAALAAAGASVKAARVRLETGESLPVDFGAEEKVRDAHQRARQFASGLAVIAALIAVYGLFLAWQASAEISRDREQAAALMESLRNADAAKGATPLLGAANSLHDRRRDRPPAIAVLNELSAILPRNVWLESVALDDAGVELKGQGSDIPALIAVLEGSSSFKDVNFAAATQLNEELQSNAFSIGAALEKGAIGDAAP